MSIYFSLKASSKWTPSLLTHMDKKNPALKLLLDTTAVELVIYVDL